MSLFIEALGVITPVGLNVPQTMGSLRTGLDFFEEMQFFGADGEAVVGASVPLPDSITGLERDATLLASALQECAQGAVDPLPLLLCLPEGAGHDVHFLRLLERAQKLSSVPLLREGSMAFPEGRAAVARALTQAHTLLTARRFPACYVAGVDSLLHPERLEALMAKDRLRHEENTDGLVPGEAAACLRVSLARTPRALAQVAGLGLTVADGPPGGAKAISARADAARQALHQARVSMGQVDFVATDSTGERPGMRELSVALVRLKARRETALASWSPAMSAADTGAAAGVLALAYLSFRQAMGAHQRAPTLWMGASDGGLRGSALLLPGQA